MNYVVTTPGTGGLLIAFMAEAFISFLIMTMILNVSNHARLNRWTGLCAGLLVALYITLESPISGMSMNPALKNENITLLTNSKVQKLKTDASGRTVTSVVVEREGAIEEFTADFIVVSCGAINSAALLLRSANDMHPRGLANSSDVVGRHYMGHVNSVVMALSKCPNPTVFQKTLAVNDFYFGSKEWDFPMGHISFVGKLDGATLRAGAPAIAPGFTLEMMATYSLDFWLTSEDLPDPNNRVTLDREGNIVLSYQPNNEEGHKRLKAKLQSLMQQQTKLIVSNAKSAAQNLLMQKTSFISSGVVAVSEKGLGFTQGFLVRDPDGHVMQLVER